MSKQLAISASASVFAMAAFALFATPPAQIGAPAPFTQTGATAHAAAPASGQDLPDLADLIG